MRERRLPLTRPDQRRLLSGVADGLDLVQSTPDGGRPWQAVGLVLALQSALALALTGYESAQREDILDPNRGGEPDRLAPVSLLMRRASSDRCLNDPERLRLSKGEKARMQTIVRLRNSTLHPIGDAVLIEDDEWLSAVLTTIDTLDHLLSQHPAFDPSPFTLELVGIGDRIRRLRDRFAPH